MKTKFLWCHFVVTLMVLVTPWIFAEELVSVQVSRVDEKGEVSQFQVRGEWQWGSSVPCVRVQDQRIIGTNVKPCLTEATTVVPIKKSTDDPAKVTARYIFDLPFDHLVVLLSRLCVEQGLRLESTHQSQGFGVVAITCDELKKIRIQASPGLRVRDLGKTIGNDFSYEVSNPAHVLMGQFALLFPRPKPTPTPIPSPSPVPLPSPTPKPTPKPIVKAPEVKRNWVLGAYLGLSSVSHTNVAPTGGAQTLSWKGGQVHVYLDAMKSEPLIYGLIPEIELHGNQLGSLAGFTLINASVSRNLSKSKNGLLLLGFGGNLIGMNGSSQYGIITSMGYGLHLSWRSIDQRYFVSGSMGPLLTPVPSFKSAWFGITGDYRIYLFHRPVHLGIDLTWLKVPGSTSGANIDYSSKSYGLMLGYHFGE